MPQSEMTYTYRAGKRLELRKRPDQFVVRAVPEKLKELGIPDAERVSPSSSRITCKITELEPLMSRARHIAPTHHAYYDAKTGAEFLTTDRILVTFKEPLSSLEVDTFAGRYGLIKQKTYSDREYLFQLTDQTGMNPVK